MFQSLLLLATALMLLSDAIAQQHIVTEIERKMSLFQYEEVISLTDSIFNINSALNDQDKIKLKLMSGMAAFSLGDEDKAKQSFIDLLNLNSGYQPDPSIVSPKIISFFEEIRNEYLTYIAKNDFSSPKTTGPSLYPGILQIEKDILLNSAVRSVVFPGWGHLYAGGSTKGWILAGLNTAVSGSLVYFIIDTNQKEKSYLNETDKNLIQIKYDDYNRSFSTRNLLIAATAILWIYTQIDLFFLSDEMFGQKLNEVMKAMVKVNTMKDAEIAIRINF